MESNPYTAPSSVPTNQRDAAMSPSDNDANDPTLLQIAKPVFRSWEKLRVVYVGLLTLLTLVLLGRELLTLRVLAEVVFGAIAVNVAFFAGPILETYVRWLGYRGPFLRWVLFGLGTLFSILVTLIALLSIALAPLNQM